MELAEVGATSCWKQTANFASVAIPDELSETWLYHFNYTRLKDD